jgi:hypothetical protein
MKPFRKIFTACLLALMITTASQGCMNRPVTIVSAKTASGIDEKLLPTKVMSVFPSDSKTVHFWFQWKNAKVGTPITASWFYTTDDIHILDHEFIIPRKKGSGSVSMTMPGEKTLPVGSYRVDLSINGAKQKSVTFKVS